MIDTVYIITGEYFMENKNIIIILLVIIVILLAAVLGIMMLQSNAKSTPSEINQTDITVDEPTNSVTPDTIKVELPEYDQMYTETAGEYSVEAEKWMGGSVGGFEVHLYKNGEPVDKDSYMTRAYFYMDGEWKWSEWGNGENGYPAYHRYPVSNGVEIQEVEVKF